MEIKENDFYSWAHLFVAAVRVCAHRQSVPPALEDVCNLLSISTEHGGVICRKLIELQVLESAGGSFDDRLFIRDHLKLESIPRQGREDRLAEELKKFRDAQKAFSKKIESIRNEQVKKKKNLFAEIEKKLQEEFKKK